MRCFLLVPVTLVALVGCGERPAPPPEPEKPSAVEVKILQFYASPGEVARGQETLICYGVEGARSVRIEPEVEQLRPVLTRCFQVKPERTTTYTLYAEGEDGATVSESFTVTVKGVAAPPKNTARQILRLFSASATQAAAGHPVTLCYSAPDAKSVRVKPDVQPLEPAESHCFMVRPRQSTTYALTAVAADGATETEEVTITVR